MDDEDEFGKDLANRIADALNEMQECEDLSGETKHVLATTALAYAWVMDHAPEVAILAILAIRSRVERDDETSH